MVLVCPVLLQESGLWILVIECPSWDKSQKEAVIYSAGATQSGSQCSFWDWLCYSVESNSEWQKFMWISGLAGDNSPAGSGCSSAAARHPVVWGWEGSSRWGGVNIKITLDEIGEQGVPLVLLNIPSHIA